MMRALAVSVFGMALLAAGTTAADPATPEHPRRNEIWPEETGSMPRGFHVETRPNYRPILGGAIMTGVGGLLLATGIDQRNQRHTRGAPGTPGSGGEFFIIPGVVCLAVGLPWLAYGLLSRREVYVRDPAPPLQVGFSLGQRHVAAGLTYAF
jgi:hypothetical protein